MATNAVPRVSTPASSWRIVPWAVAAGTFVLLLATASGYGWHRDELYFVAIGDTPAWAYPDQPALTPLLAHALYVLGGGSLLVVRLAPALAAAAIVLLAAATARELGGTARAIGLTAVVTAAGPLVLLNGHLFSTAALDILAGTAVTWCFVRAVRRNDARWILLAGAVTGIGMHNKTLLAAIPGALALGLAAVGPRDLLRRGWTWAGGALAVVIAAPTLIWQAANGWPQLTMSGRIADRFDLGEFVLVTLAVLGLLLIPVAVAGLVGLLRGGGLRPYRFVAVAWILLVLLLLLARGKAYYAAGLVPAVIAAGAIGVDGWLERGRRRLRGTVLGVAVGVQFLVSAVVALPLVPVESLAGTPVPDLNGESAETVGWPQLVDTVVLVQDALPADARDTAVVVTANYGEAGALELLGPDRGLVLPVFSGHNALADEGPPPADAAPVVLVGGWSDRTRAELFGDCEETARIDNGAGLDNEEQGAGVYVCAGPAGSWADTWPSIRHLD